MTNKYEALMIFSVAGGEEAVNGLKEKFSELIAKNGTVENVDEWGVRKFAYLINDMSEGYYVLFNFTSSPEFPAELERNCNISDDILRSLIISKE